jgi:acetylornithine deacetylase/succinyl-diaminopimelate desuccinylase-like protein
MADHQVEAIQYAHTHQDQFLQELEAFCEIPSISTDPQYAAEMQKCANWVANRLQTAGIEHVTVYPTQGHPVVYGDYLKAGDDAPTVLIYGHYDVQPAEPLDKWSTDPFKPEIKGENLYARGATDMKAQVMATIKAVESILKTGALPVNVKFMIEGEEEIGSPNLDEFIQTHRDQLACDVFLNPDTGMINADTPTITYGLRGLAYFEIRLRGARSDLHSGVFGGVVHNPAQVLCELIAGMHDGEGRVTLPGFYDSVRALGEEERAELNRLPMNEETFLELSGAPQLWKGERPYTAVERQGARPTLEINGIISGFTGEGSKTVLPAAAMAKISMRLVPDQDPVEVGNQLRAYLQANTPPTVTWEISELTGSKASISDRHSAGVQALSQALEKVWGKRVVYKREGGSVPVVTQMQQILNVDAVNTGFSTPGDNMHGPDEKTHLPSWRKGIDALIYFFFNFS